MAGCAFPLPQGNAGQRLSFSLSRQKDSSIDESFFEILEELLLFRFRLSLAQKIRVDERLDLSIKNTRRVGRFFICTQILHQLIRLKNIAADLGAPFHLLLFGEARIALRFFFLAIMSGDHRGEHFQSRCPVLNLRPFRLAACDDTRRDMRHTDC